MQIQWKLTDTLVSGGQLQLRTFFSFPGGVRLRELPRYNCLNKITDRFSPNLSLHNMMESLVDVSCYTGSPTSKYEHRRVSALLRNIQNIRICMGKKTFRFSDLRKSKDFNKKQLTLLKMCVTSLLCGPRADLCPWGPNNDFVFIFHFSIFVFHFLIFTSPFSFSVANSVFIFYFSVFVYNVLIFTFPFSFSVFSFYFSVFIFNVLIFTSPFCFSVEISVFRFFTFLFLFLTFFIFTDRFRFTFQFLF